VQVKLADGTPLDAERLFAKHTHVCARRHSGEIVCWGRNYSGELGDGTFASRGLPAPHTASCP
jgi:alpha-tubulin suppressor-like RCC1 family protein